MLTGPLSAALNLPIRSGVPAENALDVIDAQVHNSMFAQMSGLGGSQQPSSSYSSSTMMDASNWRKDSSMSDATIAVPPMDTMQAMQDNSNPRQSISMLQPNAGVGKKTGGTTFTKCPEGERMHCLVVDDDT